MNTLLRIHLKSWLQTIPNFGIDDADDGEIDKTKDNKTKTMTNNRVIFNNKDKLIRE